MYQVFIKEPWGKAHIARVYKKLQPVVNSKMTIAELMQNDFFDEGEQWFILHLVMTWYLGVYYHEKMPDQRIMYEEALMHESVKDFVPIRFLEKIAFGEWGKPPKILDNERV